MSARARGTGGHSEQVGGPGAAAMRGATVNASRATLFRRSSNYLRGFTSLVCVFSTRSLPWPPGAGGRTNFCESGELDPGLDNDDGASRVRRAATDLDLAPEAHRVTSRSLSRISIQSRPSSGLAAMLQCARSLRGRIPIVIFATVYAEHAQQP